MMNWSAPNHYILWQRHFKTQSDSASVYQYDSDGCHFHMGSCFLNQFSACSHDFVINCKRCSLHLEFETTLGNCNLWRNSVLKCMTNIRGNGSHFRNFLWRKFLKYVHCVDNFQAGSVFLLEGVPTLWGPLNADAPCHSLYFYIFQDQTLCSRVVNTPVLYLGVPVEILAWRLSILIGFLLFSLVSSRKWQDGTLKLGHDYSFHILSKSSFTYRPFIWRYIIWVTEKHKGKTVPIPPCRPQGEQEI
jgi:hypothetical protein